MITPLEQAHMRELAHEVRYANVRPTPNPRVGCRIIDANGEFISQGIHGTAGTDHAEVIALRAAGDRARGATALVTLEPCNHWGKTGPCSEALIAAGVARVVYGSADPNPDAAGGAEKMIAAGIQVVGDAETHLTYELIEPWWFSTLHQRPFVTLKIASTLDGYVAAQDGSSRWITSEQARIEVHHLRARVDAVAVGTATAVADNPRLDVRLEGEWPQPQRFILGNRELPVDLKMENWEQIRSHEPREMLAHMFDRGVRHVMVEGGASIAAAFIRAGLVDQLLWFTAPKLLGSGISAVESLGITNINDAVEWHLLSVLQLGNDVMLDLRPQHRAG